MIRIAHSPWRTVFVMPGLDPGIHVLACAFGTAWMAGTSPAMTIRKYFSEQSFSR
jgi:hypothetical protein